MTSDLAYEAPTVDALRDTWVWRQDGAAWFVDLVAPSLDPTILGPWWADLVDEWLDDFADLVRVREVSVVDDDAGHLLTRQPEESFAVFRNRVVTTLRTHPVRLAATTFDLDLHAWVRTAESPDRPIHGWVTVDSLELYVHIGDDGDGYASFDLPVSLFSPAPRSNRPASNLELHGLNQPVLRRALERWAARTGQSLQLGGELPFRREFGFAHPDDDD